MKTSLLPFDDQVSTFTSLDQRLLLQLEAVVSQHFYGGCDRITQALLAQCQWSLVANLDTPILKIICPDAETYWNIVGNIEHISDYLSRVTRTGKIEVIPGDKKNVYFEIELGA
ncbi:MAG: hypothetical protein HC769_34000 [Cyanobacteria bacterium CRU_2_1]|nr:hypothetical protein [Cyanobacteria bacterium CRU_2_1]